MIESEFEAAALALIGRSIIGVRYYVLKNEGEQSDFEGSTEYDSLDFGVEFLLDSEDIYSLIWGAEFFQYGVSVIPGTLKSQVLGGHVVDVSDCPNWNGIIGNTINNVEIVWGLVESRDNASGSTESVRYPQSVTVKNQSNKEVIISAIEIRGEKIYDMMDHITIFFNRSVAGKCKAL